ncbi:hypothetical protein ACC754_39780, partial [Rhizobium johnstonii]
IAGWGLAAVFMMLWLFSIRMRNYALHDSKAAQRMDMRIAVYFVTDVLEPATNDLFASRTAIMLTSPTCDRRDARHGKAAIRATRDR